MVQKARVGKVGAEGGDETTMATIRIERSGGVL